MRWDQDLYKRALDFAAAAHGDQKVPGSGAPYVVHLAKVAAEVLWASQTDAFDVNLAMGCALLHDTMEDAGVSRQALERDFGEAVAGGVQALTKDEALPKEARMDDSLRRIRAVTRPVSSIRGLPGRPALAHDAACVSPRRVTWPCSEASFACLELWRAGSQSPNRSAARFLRRTRRDPVHRI